MKKKTSSTKISEFDNKICALDTSNLDKIGCEKKMIIKMQQFI